MRNQIPVRVPTKHGYKFKDLTGMRFGRLVVLEYAGVNSANLSLWKCKCDCGNECIVLAKTLLRGTKNSCGCLHNEITGDTFRTHGLRLHRLYRIHYDMCRRCYDPRRKNYKDYGGRGIRVCDEWYTPGVKGNPGFVAFYNWAYENGYYDQPKGTPYKKLLTIDRKNVNGNYEPKNCRWSTWKEQQNNRRNNFKIYDGEEVLTETQFGEKYNVDPSFVNRHLKRGRTLDQIIYIAKTGDMVHTASDGYTRDKDGFIRLIRRYDQSKILSEE